MNTAIFIATATIRFTTRRYSEIFWLFTTKFDDIFKSWTWFQRVVPPMADQATLVADVSRHQASPPIPNGPGSPAAPPSPQRWTPKQKLMWSFLIFSLRKHLFEHRHHDLTLFFSLVQPLRDMLSFICVPPLFSSQALSPVSPWQLFAETHSSFLSLSWHFVFSACVTKALRCDSSLPSSLLLLLVLIFLCQRCELAYSLWPLRWIRQTLRASSARWISAIYSAKRSRFKEQNGSTWAGCILDSCLILFATRIFFLKKATCWNWAQSSEMWLCQLNDEWVNVIMLSLAGAVWKPAGGFSSYLLFHLNFSGSSLLSPPDALINLGHIVLYVDSWASKVNAVFLPHTAVYTVQLKPFNNLQLATHFVLRVEQLPTILHCSSF